MIADSQPVGSFASSSPSQGVASLLRETRLKLGRDIGVAATTLRIRQPYLQAIEDGRFQDLPGSTYAVGFVRGYAEYLGLDGNEIVRRFKQENSDLAGRAELVFPSTGSGSGLPTVALLGIAVVGAAIAYGVWYWLQDRPDVSADAVPPLPERLAALIHKPVGDGSDVVAVSENNGSTANATPNAATTTTEATQAPADQPPSPPVAAVETPPPAAVLDPAPVAMTEPPKPANSKSAEVKDDAKAAKQAKAQAVEAARVEGDNPSAILPAAPVATAADGAVTDAPKPAEVKPVWHASKRLKLRADDTCWIKIRDADGKIVLSRLLHKGDMFAPPDAPGLVMTVGSAGALTLLVDGRETPSLGAVGAVKKVGLDPDILAGSAASTPSEAPPSHNDNN